MTLGTPATSTAQIAHTGTSASSVTISSHLFVSLLLIALISVPFLIWFISRAIARSERYRKFIRQRPALASFFQDNATVVICVGVGIGLSLYWITLNDISLLHQVGKYIPNERRGTHHYMNILAVIGLVFAAVGIWFTFLQLRFENSKIEQYRSFYRWIQTLFEEIDREKSSVFHFFGSTILPGNLAYNDQHALDYLENRLRSLYGTKDSDQQVARARILVPNDAGYTSAYEYYGDRIISTAPREVKRAWAAHVNNARNTALKLQHALMNDDARSRQRFVYTVNPGDIERFSWLQKAYYMSNGKRVIFAIPLHYLSSSTDGSSIEVTPSLIGMTTTNPGIIDALEQLFDRLCDSPAPADRLRELDNMYRKHPIKPIWVGDEIARQVSTGVEPSAALDIAHDHFLGRVETDDCIEALLPIDEHSNVLDLGSGLGGPAVYLSLKYPCAVTGIELQPDRADCANRLATLCRSHVVFIKSDILEYVRDPANQGRFSHVLSILSILHCHEKREVLQTLGSVLQSGGCLCIEDYVAAKKLTNADKERLMNVISCPSLLSLPDYLYALELGGLSSIEVSNRTGAWHLVASERSADFSSPTPRSLAFPHLTEDEKNMARSFADGVKALFDDGVISGIRVTARKL